MNLDLPAPAIIAHRGANASAPENTLAAFKMALTQEADGIELDTKLTADGQIVVIHDRSIDRTTPGKGRVKEMTLADLRRLDAGSHFDIAYRGEPIPTLEEVLKAVGQLTYIDIELANYTSLVDQLPEKVARLVRRMKLSHRVFFSSFNPIALIRVRRLLPECPIGLLALPGSKGWLARGWIGRLLAYDILITEYHDVTLRLVRSVHHRGNKIFTYVANCVDDVQRMALLGVDGIITDDPLCARQALQAQTAAQGKTLQEPREHL